MFNLSLDTRATITFGADSVLSVILLWYVGLDIQRRALVVSYVRLVLFALSILISGWLHLAAVSVALGVGSSNLDSTVTLLSRSCGRALGPKIAAPATLFAAFGSAMLYRVLKLDPANVFRILPFVHLVWLAVLTTLLESSFIGDFLSVPTETWPSIIQFIVYFILAVLQVVMVCCLIDVLALLRERCRAKQESEDI